MQTHSTTRLCAVQPTGKDEKKKKERKKRKEKKKRRREETKGIRTFSLVLLGAKLKH